MKIQLQTTSILGVPLKNCDEPFSFIVNGKAYQTNRITAHLISPEIRRIYSIDPTINEYTIKTAHQGDFQKILNLTSFEIISIQDDELYFIEEVSEFLKIGSIQF